MADPELVGPDPLQLALEKAKRFNAIGRHGDAERELLQGLGQRPEDVRLLCELARTRIEDGRYGEALEPAERAVHLAPEFCSPHALLALVHLQDGRHVEAEREILEALRIDPESAWCYRVYGKLLLKTGHLEKAEQILRRGLALDPDDAQAHSLLALVHADRREGEQARARSLEGLDRAPDDEMPHAALAWSCYLSGHPFRARRHLREALRIDPDPDLEELYLEADRACRWIYLPFYHYSLLIDRLPGKQFGLWGLFLVFLFLSRAVELPSLVVGAVVISYVGLAIYTWIAGFLVKAWIRVVPPAMTDASVIAAIQAALDKDPRNGALWLHLAELLEGAERTDEALAEIAPGGRDEQDWAAQFDWGDLRLTLDDVAGLEGVKRQIHLRIVAPFRQPEIYQAFRREAGGGILLYGPPGCGKTYVARATAGELDARFVVVSIHDVVDKYWGESEKLIHGLFEEARRSSPTVLFFDEFDALGGSRGRGGSDFWRTLVDSLLQEMDGIEGRNREVLVFAATNSPWNVDSAFRRPGRFNRVIFVAPPDESARRAILARGVGKVPGGAAVGLDRLVHQTPLFTGADLVELCERATERALERSLEGGKLHEVAPEDFAEALEGMQSTALEWLATARNYARYSNQGGQYDELTSYLKSVRKW